MSKCDDNCLNCKLKECIFDHEDDNSYVKSSFEKREYNQKYYAEHKEIRNKQHRQWYKAHREEHLIRAKNYYNDNKEFISKKRKEQRRVKRMNNKERIGALMGNLKNWTWDVNPQFRIEKEDAIALQDRMAFKEFIKEEREYEKRRKLQNV